MSVNVVSSNKTFTDLYEDHLNNVVVFGNPDATTEFQSHVKMEFWGENYISLHEEGVKGIPTLQNDIIELDLGNRKLQWFKDDRLKWSSIHWVEILKSKPTSNKWTLFITDNDEFTFCYQQLFVDIAKTIPGSCIEYFIQDNVEWIRLIYPPGLPIIHKQRPLDVDGSIAVYHKTKKNNNYKTGKALHILRPKAVDKNGKWTWCDIQVVEKKYIRVIPQDFLDIAAYPVVINDTFGYTSIGGTPINYQDDYQLVCGPWSPAANGSATAAHAYLSTITDPSSSRVTLGIWNESGGNPDTLAKDTAGGATSYGGAWYEQSLDSALSVLSASQYFLGGNTDDHHYWYSDDDGITEDFIYDTDADVYNHGTLNDFGGVTILDADTRYSVYVTYTPSPVGNAGIMTTNPGIWGPTF
jgi:hypothetical protein